MTIKSLVAAATLAATTLFAMQAQANVILNGGFELDNASVKVPTDWSANSAYNSTAFNTLVSDPVHSGDFALRISNDENQPVPVLSQSFTDVAGATYVVDYFAANGN